MIKKIIILFLYLLILIYIYFKIILSSNFGVQKPGVKIKGKKVALCISGQFRDECKITLYSIKKYIIDVLDVDVFFNLTPVKNTKIQNDLLELLKPKRYVFENINTDSYINKYSKNYKIMMTRIINCNELKKQEEINNGYKYDIVIRIRPDLLMKSSIHDSIIDSDMTNKLYYYDFLYFPVCSSYGISDQLFLTDSATMDKLLVPEAIHSTNTKCLYSEYFLYKHCYNIGIKLHIFLNSSILYKLSDCDFFNIIYNFVKDKGIINIVQPKFVCDIIDNSI